jgi:hypothetical protein
VGGEPPSDPRARRHAPMPGDLLDVKDLDAVEHGQMDCFVCRLEKILHEGQRLLPEIPLKGNELTELEHPHPEPVNTTLAFQETQREQFAGQALDRRLRDARTAGHFRKGQLSIGRG